MENELLKCPGCEAGLFYMGGRCPNCGKNLDPYQSPLPREVEREEGDRKYSREEVKAIRLHYDKVLRRTLSPYPREEHPFDIWFDRNYPPSTPTIKRHDEQADRGKLVKFLHWFLLTYMGSKPATENQAPIVVDRYLQQFNLQK